MPDAELKSPKVFISYSHDSPEHADWVLGLSNRLLGDGIDCILDQYEEWPPTGWPRWMTARIKESDFVLMVCTEPYYRRVMGEEKAGVGLGVRWEGNLVYNELYAGGTVNHKFLPLIPIGGSAQHVPDPLQGFPRFSVHTEDGYRELYRRLTLQRSVEKPVLGKLKTLNPRTRVQDFFASERTYWNVPQRNDYFTGRGSLLDDLHTRLTEHGAAGLGQRRSEAISGLGGIGKTQTAIEYAHTHRSEYRAIFWIRADSESELRSSFSEIAHLLKLPEKDAQEQELAVSAALAWLERENGWLLIFDNAEDPKAIRTFIPRDGALGAGPRHVLLTARENIFDSLGITKPIDIDVMKPNEAVDFLFDRTGRDRKDPKEEAAALKLSEDLGFLPLALEQAAAYIHEVKCGFQSYLESFKRRQLELLEKRKPVTGDYKCSVTTTWLLNFEQIEKASPAAADLLRLSAFLQPDVIPLELISRGASQLGPALSEALKEVENDPLVLDELLSSLRRYSLIRRDEAENTYSIHRMVQAVIRSLLKSPEEAASVKRAVNAVSQAFPKPEFKNWRVCERFLQQALNIPHLIDRVPDESHEGARLLDEVATYLQTRARFGEAEALRQRALEMRETVLGQDHIEVAEVLNNLAELYRHQGKFTEAEPLYLRSLVIVEKSLGKNHPTVAAILNNQALLYQDQGELAVAEPIQLRALEIWENALGRDHPNIATCLNNLASLFLAQGKLDHGEPLLLRALEIREKALGRDHPDVAAILNNLGAIYQAQRKLAEAEPLARRSLGIWEKALGRDHPSVATSLNNLARLYQAEGKPAEAEPLFKRAIEINEKAYDRGHPNTAAALENYAGLLMELNRENEARELLARAAKIREKHEKRQKQAKGGRGKKGG